ncbi:unnamed protein product [Callosobruchus maculatus]|uniref:Uncharacterized protein n=1 Tax=Callosobruchus maculatus TaxID=64391 RepID=A0A653DSG6_CALMS|nr:unnamed protein product [Callosobruchus maculatus]
MKNSGYGKAVVVWMTKKFSVDKFSKYIFDITYRTHP